MSRYLCIHAHFYQPPRENPWLEEVELQDSAYPYHDWNARITAECYAPNAASRILDGEGRIIEILNNYSRISFNFGPTLLSWMETNSPDVYASILEANRLSRERFGGHGSALAQVYNHMVMPLASPRDKKTQIAWGVRDFTYRYGAPPEGIWLAETAVDVETLDLCLDYGLSFTILAPRQAKAVRRIGDKEWTDVSGDRIDPKRAYRCLLPSGRYINLFFYDGPVSQELAFGDVLADGRRFADRLVGAFRDDPAPQLMHIATDGETYGHHHRHGDMALAYCLYHVEQAGLAELIIYARYLELHPPEYEVEIFDNSSWSCIHGIERWRSACGCNTGGRGDWNQLWRVPLRGAMDWLRDSLVMVFQEYATRFLRDPWAARDDYIDVILDRSDLSVERFFQKHSLHPLSPDERVTSLQLLEMQRHAMLMYTSCGWFFDEITGIEAMQVVQYSARAMQLARDVAGIDLEPAYIKILERAKPNIPRFATAGDAYLSYIKPSVLDLPRVGAHYAASSLFAEAHEDTAGIFSYCVTSEAFDRVELGRQRLVIGKAVLRSNITHEEALLYYAFLHLGEQNVLGSVTREIAGGTFDEVAARIRESFQRGNLAEVITLSDIHFGAHSYSLWHLFKDEQRRIVGRILNDMLADVELQFRSIFQRNQAIMQAVSEMGVPIPRPLFTTAAFVINTDIAKTLREIPVDVDRLGQLAADARRWNVELDRIAHGFDAGEQVNRMVREFEQQPYDAALLDRIRRLLDALRAMPVDLDVWQAQNRWFALSKSVYPRMLESSGDNQPRARRWVESFRQVAELLHVGVK